jgi:molybdopterin converting factor subunit 1
MTVTVLLFASYAEQLGRSSITLELPEGARVQDALSRVQAEAAGRLPAKPMVAVNQSYAKGSDVLRSGDELAIIPPVAGG